MFTYLDQAVDSNLPDGNLPSGSDRDGSSSLGESIALRSDPLARRGSTSRRQLAIAGPVDHRQLFHRDTGRSLLTAIPSVRTASLVTSTKERIRTCSTESAGCEQRWTYKLSRLAYFMGVRTRCRTSRSIRSTSAGRTSRTLSSFSAFTRSEVGIDLSALTAPDKVSCRPNDQAATSSTTAFVSASFMPMGPSCAVCRLKHSELLDASRTSSETRMTDRRSRGVPTEWLCARSITPPSIEALSSAISPDLIVKDQPRDCSTKLMARCLKHGLQEMHGSTDFGSSERMPTSQTQSDRRAASRGLSSSVVGVSR